MDNEQIKYQKNSVKKKILNVFFSFILLIGLGIMFYPTISNIYYNVTTAGIIEEYKADISKKTIANKEEILNKAKEYNQNNVVYQIEDIFTTNKIYKDKDYDNILKINDEGLIAYIEIPKIKVKLPIYHGTSDEVLNKGIGHLKGSSFPIGGEKNHTILAGHRGLPSAKLFTDVNLLKKGDIFTIYVLDEILTYEVDKISVVKPNEVHSLQVNDNGDYVSLVTCTPYAVNTHRLIIRGKRIENLSKKQMDGIKPAMKVSTGYFIITTLGMFVIIILLIAIIYRIIKIINNRKSKQ